MTADSRFTSIPLAIDLLQQNCKLLGTIVKKPEIPSDLKDSKRTQAAGTTSFLYSKKKKIMHVSCKPQKNEKPVPLISLRPQSFYGRNGEGCFTAL